MSDTQSGERTKPTEIGWFGLEISLPVVLLGRGGILAFLILWLGGPFIPLESLSELLSDALVPLAVIFGFGLKRFEEIGDRLRSAPDSDDTRGRFLQVVLVYGGSITALAAVLLYSLIPEFELPYLFPPDLIAVLGTYRLITLTVVTLVLLPVVLIFRYPFLTTTGGERLTEILDRPSMSGHWEQRRRARYWDALIVLVLFILDSLVFSLSDRWLPEEGYLLKLALAGLLYEAVCTLFRGRTVGKWHRGVRVVGLDDNPASRRCALARAFLIYVPLFVFGILMLDGVVGASAAVMWVLVLAWYGLGTAHPYGRGVHDVATGTRITTPSDPLTDPQPNEAAVDAAPVRGLRLPRPELEAMSTRQRPFRQNNVSSTPTASTWPTREVSASRRASPQRPTAPVTVCQSQPSSSATSSTDRPSFRQTDPVSRPRRSPTERPSMSTTPAPDQSPDPVPRTTGAHTQGSGTSSAVSATADEPADRTPVGPPTPLSDSPWTTPIHHTPHRSDGVGGTGSLPPTAYPHRRRRSRPGQRHQGPPTSRPCA